MSSQFFQYLDVEAAEFILKLSPENLIVNDTVIVYEGQTPNIVCCIHRGILKINNNEYEFGCNNQSVLVLMNQFKLGHSVNEKILVKEGSLVSILDNSNFGSFDSFVLSRKT
jgi:hypothetical protein